ncbi:hypothetical protein Tco_1082422 [Tanacetum coccineum]|uniref:Uncharacterized protein n=1 Tax=Tanacetum coccineum TaxID=301880 RepID=A0ABQ5I2I1_9ASTR
MFSADSPSNGKGKVEVGKSRSKKRKNKADGVRAGGGAGGGTEADGTHAVQRQGGCGAVQRQEENGDEVERFPLCTCCHRKWHLSVVSFSPLHHLGRTVGAVREKWVGGTYSYSEEEGYGM